MHDDHPPHGRLRVLVVDDNEDAATTLSLLLELEGHRTGTAYNGQDAVTAAAENRYDAVLLDLNMPVMDGFEAARVLGQLLAGAEADRLLRPLIGGHAGAALPCRADAVGPSLQ